MTINQLTVFAQNGEKNTTGLTQADGFPSTQKPARQWFNFLLNTITVKINEIINEKADKNGNPLQRFKVANAVDNDEAASKGQLDGAISTEADTRADADTALQQQIDNLTLSVLKKAWPIGSVYENRFDARNPSHQDLLGFGTWVTLGEGRVTVGYQNGDPDFGTVGQTGGKKDHKMTINNLIEHDHEIDGRWLYGNGEHFATGLDGGPLGVDGGNPKNKTKKTGSNDPTPIPTLSPYIVVMRWVRTA